MRLTPRRTVSAPRLVVALLASCSSSPSTGSAAEPDGTYVSASASGDHELVPDTQVTLTFAQNGITANAACNTLSGPVTLTDGVLKAGNLISTLKGCPQDLADQDKWLQSFLTSGPSWQLSGDTLTLTNGSDQLTLSHTG